MKRLLLLAALLAGNLFAQISAPKNLRIAGADPTPIPTPAPTPNPGDAQDIDLTGFRLVFEENFDVLSVADTDAKGDKTWYFWPPYGAAGAFSTSHWATWRMECVNGILINTAAWNSERNDSFNNNWESGCLSSMDKIRAGFAQHYGYWSARVKMPDAGWSAWPAFWLASVSGIPNGGSKGYEIDIFEWYGDYQAHVGHSVHPWNSDGSQGEGEGGGFAPIPGGDGINTWHIYGCKVDPEHITFYIDGIQTMQFKTNPEYLQDPLYIIIDYAVRGNPPSGYKFDTKQPSSMLVDWVRAYKLPNDPPPPPPGPLVQNPSFDEDNADVQEVKGWEEWSDIGSNPNGFTRSGDSHSGTRYYRMEGNGPYRLYLSQVVPIRESGTYTMRAWVKSSGGQNAMSMGVKDYDGPEKWLGIPATNVWMQVEIKDIEISGFQIRIGFWSDANPGNWVAIDDVEFFKQ